MRLIMIKQLLLINEKRYIEDLVNNDLKPIENKPLATLKLLSKYYHLEGYTKNKVEELLIKFLQNRYPKYYDNKAGWATTCAKIVKVLDDEDLTKDRLLECDGIPITEKELERINEITAETGIEKKNLQRLTFTILVLTKYQAIKNPEYQYHFANLKTKDIFNLARVSANTYKQDLLLNELYQQDLIFFPENNNKENAGATFIDKEGAAKLLITDLREIGYQYNKYRGDNFFTCKSCGITVKQYGGNEEKQLCKSCAESKDKEYYRCVDCGVIGQRFKNTALKVRCAECQAAINRANKAEWRLKKKRLNNAETQEAA